MIWLILGVLIMQGICLGAIALIWERVESVEPVANKLSYLTRIVEDEIHRSQPQQAAVTNGEPKFYMETVI